MDYLLVLFRISSGRLLCIGSPLYLKSHLGEGYRLTMVKQPLYTKQSPVETSPNIDITPNPSESDQADSAVSSMSHASTLDATSVSSGTTTKASTSTAPSRAGDSD